MAAELAPGIAVGSEGFVAVCTGEVMPGSRVRIYQELVGTPPFLAACIGAEDPLLALGNLDDFLSALLACTFCCFAGCSEQFFLGSAKAAGLDGSLRQGEVGGNMAVGAAEAAHLKDPGFLVFGHRVLLHEAVKPYPGICVMHRYRSFISSSWMRAHRLALNSFRMRVGI